MRNCMQIIELSSQQLEQTLPILTRLEMKFHFLICRFCRCYTNQLAFMHKALAAMETHSVDLHLSIEAKQRIAKNIYSSESAIDQKH